LHKPGAAGAEIAQKPFSAGVCFCPPDGHFIFKLLQNNYLHDTF
jgi:hypothetical protein